MKNYLLPLLLLCSVSYAQVVGVQPTPGVPYTQSSNLLNPTVSSWAGTVAGQNAGFVGGTTPAFNAGTNTIIFGYVMAPATQTIAINQALAAVGAGIKIGGFSYSWNIQNDPMAGQYGTVSSSITLRDSAGSILQNYRSNYPQMPGAGFVTYSGTQWFPQDYSLPNVSTLDVSFTGKDQTYWAGYYGPQVRNPSLSLQYTPDLCASNPLSSPNCPGYAAAYQTQQCSLNPLFDPSCPGYTLAQCNINPLFSPICPNYQAAYLAQQCSLNPLYDPICPGYAAASAAQQCSVNPLSDVNCPGYAAAYLTQQCSLNPLYDTSCPGYAAAYAKKNILNTTTTSTASSTTTTTKVSTVEPTVSVSSSGKVETAVSKTGDSAVDSVIETKATAAAPDVTATVQLTPSPSTGGQNVGTQTVTQTQQTKTETKTTSSNIEQQTVRTARTERSEQKSGTNESKSSTEMKQASNEKAKQEMKKVESAKTFESQVAVQQNVISAMSFVPGFSTYAQSNVPDILQKQLQKQYGKDVIDNRNVGRRMFGGSDRLHEEMVGQQYR